MCVCVCERERERFGEREREREREGGWGYREEKAFPFSNRRDAQKRASSIQRTDAKIFTLFDADVLSELCLC